MDYLDWFYKLEATQVPLFTALYLHSNVSYYKSCVKFLSEYIIADGKQDILAKPVLQLLF